MAERWRVRFFAPRQIHASGKQDGDERVGYARRKFIEQLDHRLDRLPGLAWTHTPRQRPPPDHRVLVHIQALFSRPLRRAKTVSASGRLSRWERWDDQAARRGGLFGWDGRCGAEGFERDVVDGKAIDGRCG